MEHNRNNNRVAFEDFQWFRHKELFIGLKRLNKIESRVMLNSLWSDHIFVVFLVFIVFQGRKCVFNQLQRIKMNYALKTFHPVKEYKPTLNVRWSEKMVCMLTNLMLTHVRFGEALY